MIMSSKKTLLKRAAAFTLAFVLAFTTLFTGSNTVTVSAASPVTKITPAKKSITIAPKKTTNIKVTVKGGNKKFTAKSSKKSVATVKVVGKKVRITAKKAGTATVTVTTKGKNKKGKKLKAKIKVKVKAADTTTTQQPTTQQPTTQQPTTQQPTTQQPATQQPATPVAKLEKITVTANTTTITEKGGQATITVASEPAGISIASVEYTSSNTQIATVENDGVVTGVNPGDVVINVTAKDANGNPAKGSITITVTEKNKYGAKISFADKDKEKTLATGDTEKLIPIVEANDGVDVKTLPVSWKSDNEKVATVDAEGTVTAVGAGSANIIAKVDGTDATATVTITVRNRADAPSISNVVVTHADTLRVDLTSPVKENERNDIEVLLKNGEKEIKDFNKPDWASDGKSFSIKNKTKFNVGTYTVEIKTENEKVALGDTTSKKVEVVKSEIAGIKIATNAIPYAERVKVKFDVFDQYGDVRTDVQADAFDWYVTSPENTSVTGVEDAVKDDTHVGYIVINSALNGLIAGGDGRTAADSLTIRAAIKGKESGVEDKAKVPVYNLAIQSMKITGTVDKTIEESNKDQKVYFTCEAKDSQGGDVDFEMYDWGVYTQEFYTRSRSKNIVSEPKVDKDGLYATVYADKSGSATIEVAGVDQNYVPYTFEIKKAGVAETIKFPAEEACNVIAGETTEIPITFIDTYGEERDKGFVPTAKFADLFTVTPSGEQGKYADISYVSKLDGDYLVVDATDVEAEDENGNPSKINLTIKNRNSGKDSTFVLQVTDKRKPSKIVVSDEDKLKSSIMVGEQETIRYTIKDNYDEVWTKGGYTVEIEQENDDYVGIIARSLDTTRGLGAVTIEGKAKTDLAVKVPTITLSLKDSDGEKILGAEYKYEVSVEDNLSKLKANIVTPKAGKFTAGQPIEIELTALDGDDRTLVDYDEEGLVDVVPDNNDPEGLESVEYKFDKGVAKITVIARKAGEKVKFTGKILSEGNTDYTSFTTNAVEIVAGEAKGYGIEVDANNTLKIEYIDSMKNVVDTYNKEELLVITITTPYNQPAPVKDYINGIDANGYLKVQFNDGIASVNLKKSIPDNYTITVKKDALEGSKSFTQSPSGNVN